MNIADIRWDATNCYDGSAVEIYVSGCNLHCPGCHNPQLQDFDFGENLTPTRMQKLLNQLEDNRKWFDIIAVLGGDLLCQKGNKAEYFILRLKDVFSDKKLWLFTGKDLEEVPQWAKTQFDVIKTGRYNQEYLQENGILASSNQKFNYKGIDY